jgi:hypothetical protein
VAIAPDESRIAVLITAAEATRLMRFVVNMVVVSSLVRGRASGAVKPLWL